MTDAGTCAARLVLLYRVTLIPEPPAGPVSVTVPVAEFPPVTEAGFTAKLASATAPTGTTVRETDCETEPSVAVIVTTCTVEAPLVLTGTLAELWPPAMVTNCGTEATVGLLLVKCAVTRPAEGLPRVTVPVTICPLVTVSWLSVKVKGGFTVSVALFETPAKLAVTVTV